jgi:hypothetical protein
MRLGFARLLLRDGTPFYVNPHAVRLLKSVADDDDRTLIVFTDGDAEIVRGFAQNIAGELEAAASEE